MTRPRHRQIVLTIALLLVGNWTNNHHAAAQDTTRAVQSFRFAGAIDSFLKSDQVAPPPKNGILFIGSSIFRRWTHLKEQMAPLPVFNRAFGGARTNEVLYYMDRIVLPYQPRTVVYYCGSNDINGSEKPLDIFLRFEEFSRRVEERLPETQLLYVSIIRAPQKKAKWHMVDSTNHLVKEYCSRTANRAFVDVNPLFFDDAGNPRSELYLDDQLHLRDQAYVELAAIIKPILEKGHIKN